MQRRPEVWVGDSILAQDGWADRKEVRVRAELLARRARQGPRRFVIRIGDRESGRPRGWGRSCRRSWGPSGVLLAVELGAPAVGSSLACVVSLPLGSAPEGSAVVALLTLGGDRRGLFAGALLAAGFAGAFLAALPAGLLAGVAGASPAPAGSAASAATDCGGADWSPFAVPRGRRALGATWQTPYPTRA